MIDLWAEQSEKFIGTTAAILSAVAAGASAGGSIYASHKQGEAADKSLAFQQQQSQLDQQRWETTQRANYDQYVNRVKGAQQLGKQYGFTAIPDAAPYVPTPMGPPRPPSPFGPRAIGNYLPRGN